MMIKNQSSVLNGALEAWPSALLRVTGEDAAVFLQGQCTQNLRDLGEGKAARALWLTAKGRVMGETMVWRVGAIWWLWSAHTPGETLRERLEAYLIADDVVVENLGTDWRQVTLAGETPKRVWAEVGGSGQLPGYGEVAECGGGWLLAGRRGQSDVWDWLRPAAGSVGWDAASWPEMGTEALLRGRVAAGAPAIPTEFGPGDLPQEAGYEVDAISFSKGCYLGQEVMARLHAMGQVRRRLARVFGRGPAVLPGSELRQAGRRAGEVRVAVADAEGGWLGLAMLTVLGYDPAVRLETVDGVEIVPLDAPFARS